jgi:hypothetical protein
MIHEHACDSLTLTCTYKSIFSIDGLELSLYPEFQLPMFVVVGGLKPNLVLSFRPSFSFSLAGPELNKNQLFAYNMLTVLEIRRRLGRPDAQSRFMGARDAAGGVHHGLQGGGSL